MSLALVQHHPRRFRENRYVYPVISRRSDGLSIGVNLSPTARCNFACIYCQVLGDADCRLQTLNKIVAEGDRKKEIHDLSPLIDLDRLESELRNVIEMAFDGSLFEEEWLSKTPPEKRQIQDIAFSGDGEPTLAAQFHEAVKRVAAVRKKFCSESTKIVLITNGTMLHSASVRQALEAMLANNGEIWAKLDAGTPDYYRTISRSAVDFERVLANLAEAARQFPLVIQTCFLSLHGKGPDEGEVHHYANQIKKILRRGGNILRLQIYTVARSTPDPGVLPLDNGRLDDIVDKLKTATGLHVDAFYSS